MSTKRKTTEIDTVIGKNLRHLRMASKLSQQDLAEKLGVTFNQIQKYECGKNRISGANLYRFSLILNVPIQEFYVGLENSPDKKEPRLLQNEVLEILALYNQLKAEQKKNLSAMLKLLN